MALKTLIVWDMDGVIAEESESYSLTPFYNGIHEIIAEYLPETLLDDAFRAMCYEAYVEHGCCLKSLWAPKLGLDGAWVLSVYQRINLHHLLPVVKANVKANPLHVEKAMYLAGLSHVTNVCLSQGHSDYVLGMLDHTGWLGPVIKPEDVHDIVSVNGHLKRTDEPYAYIQAKYPDYDRYIMNEDSSLNLPPAKARQFETHMCGLKTVHPLAFDSIDFHHLNTDRLLEHLIATV